MKRNQLKISLGEGKIRWKVRIEDIPTVMGTPEARLRQLKFLEEMLSQPVLLKCGEYDFTKMLIWHTGEFWVCELEAFGNESIT